jgi:hypothetical protein
LQSLKIRDAFGNERDVIEADTKLFQVRAEENFRWESYEKSVRALSLLLPFFTRSLSIISSFSTATLSLSLSHALSLPLSVIPVISLFERSRDFTSGAIAWKTAGMP